MKQPRSTMNTALWAVQALSVTAIGKILCYKPVLWNQALNEDWIIG